LQRTRSDRFFALWVLEATSGMRRCELAGARRDLLDLDAGTPTIEVTRVVIDGRVIESDGKTENAQHVLALDPFTLAALKTHVETLDQERRVFGPDYHDHGVLFCWEDGRPPASRYDHAPVQKAGGGGWSPGDRTARRAAQLRHRGP
jgi:integrase